MVLQYQVEHATESVWLAQAIPTMAFALQAVAVLPFSLEAIRQMKEERENPPSIEIPEASQEQ